MESLLFTGAVFGMLWLCYTIYKSDKDVKNDSDLGLFSFKAKKYNPVRDGFKKWE